MTNASILKKRDGFTVRSMGDETLILDPDGSAIHVADEVGGFIFEQIDGCKTLQSILEAILEAYDIDALTAETDLRRFVGELSAQNILEPL